MNGRAALSLFCLAPREVCRAVRLPGFAVGSYSTISPLPVSLRAIGGIFLLHCLSGFLTSPVPHFHEARCPVVSGLSSIPPCGKTATVRGAARAPWASLRHFPIKMSPGSAGLSRKDRNAETRRKDRGGKPGNPPSFSAPRPPPRPLRLRVSLPPLTSRSKTHPGKTTRSSSVPPRS